MTTSPTPNAVPVDPMPADEKLANLEERITERVNSDEPPRFGPGRPGGPRGEVPAEEPEVEGSSFSTETASPFAA